MPVSGLESVEWCTGLINTRIWYQGQNWYTGSAWETSRKSEWIYGAGFWYVWHGPKLLNKASQIILFTGWHRKEVWKMVLKTHVLVYTALCT